MAEVLIPPWVLPESPEVIRWLDDATVVFAPAFGRGFTQRGSWGDPRWGLHRRYRGLSSDQKSAILRCLNDSRGQLNRILVTPHTPLRGSFPSTELLSNNTFASGTTGWTAFSPTSAIAVSDRTLRLSRILVNGTNGSGFYNTSGVTLTQYLPYVARAFAMSGRATAAINPALLAGTSAATATGGGTTNATSFGMASLAFVPPTTAAYFIFAGDGVAAGILVGDYLSWPYISLAQCALVDNAPNMLLQSNAHGTSPWALSNATVTASGGTAPDGSANAQNLRENTTNSTHSADQTVTVSSAAADYVLTCYMMQNSRTIGWLRLEETTSSTAAVAYFNLATGVVGTTSVGANWSNLRTYVTDVGNGWYRCSLIARKTNAATGVKIYVAAANVDGTATYAGTGTNTAIALWNASLAQSSVPIYVTPTTNAAVSATAQSGATLRIKGLPNSANGLLEVGDWFEVASQLKQATARLNSDSSGLGYLQFRPALGDSPADNDPVIISQPFGRFIYSGQQKEMQNMFGVYGDIEMDLEEVYP